jgi:hypothetical protein
VLKTPEVFSFQMAYPSANAGKSKKLGNLQGMNVLTRGYIAARKRIAEKALLVSVPGRVPGLLSGTFT